MNDDNNTLNQNTNPVVPENQVQPQAPQVSVQPIEPVAPAGGANKETGPISTTTVSEFVKPTDAEPQLSQEVKEAGVETKRDVPDLNDEHEEMGVEHSGVYIPTPSAPSGAVKLPMSEEEVAEKLKTGQDDDSDKWLARLIKKIIAVMNLEIGSK